MKAPYGPKLGRSQTQHRPGRPLPGTRSNPRERQVRLQRGGWASSGTRAVHTTCAWCFCGSQAGRTVLSSYPPGLGQEKNFERFPAPPRSAGGKSIELLSPIGRCPTRDRRTPAPFAGPDAARQGSPTASVHTVIMIPRCRTRWEARGLPRTARPAADRAFAGAGAEGT